MIRRAIYPGSFDPVTNGHLDVIDRARKLFDEVIVAVAHNDQKHPLFTLEERLDLLQSTIGNIKKVEIAPLVRSPDNMISTIRASPVCGRSTA